MNKKLFEELENEIELCKNLNVDIISINIKANPVGWKCETSINKNSYEILKETKGLDADDIKRIFDKHLEKPLNEMMEELTKISDEFLMKMVIEEMVIEEMVDDHEWH